mmetsp:Transcript_43125/g.113463  ORF Transcript_43125/g.113463 Transcript_43125/m.113463 type:complete len:215 (+) Transcript_43125:2422-3066(+)
MRAARAQGPRPPEPGHRRPAAAGGDPGPERRFTVGAPCCGAAAPAPGRGGDGTRRAPILFGAADAGATAEGGPGGPGDPRRCAGVFGAAPAGGAAAGEERGGGCAGRGWGQQQQHRCATLGGDSKTRPNTAPRPGGDGRRREREHRGQEANCAGGDRGASRSSQAEGHGRQAPQCRSQETRFGGHQPREGHYYAEVRFWVDGTKIQEDADAVAV